MKNALRIAMLLGVAPLVTTGCAPTIRYITTEGWAGNDTLYVASVELPNNEAKVLKCSRRDDNSLDCAQQTSLNSVLNKKE